MFWDSLCDRLWEIWADALQFAVRRLALKIPVFGEIVWNSPGAGYFYIWRESDDLNWDLINV